MYVCIYLSIYLSSSSSHDQSYVVGPQYIYARSALNILW